MHYISCPDKVKAISIRDWHIAKGARAYIVEYNSEWYEVRYWY